LEEILEQELILWRTGFCNIFCNGESFLGFRGVTMGARGHDSPGAESLWGGAASILGTPKSAGAPKIPNNVTSAFFNTVHLLPNDLKFENGGAELASCPGRHLTSLRPCSGLKKSSEESPAARGSSVVQACFKRTQT